MSPLSAALRERTIAPAESASDAGVCTLADLEPGATARIYHVCDDLDPATARRLVDLGFAPGARVTVVRRAPMADPVVFRVAGGELALRRRQARCISVQPDA
jgi:ferrous iron transport protein A